jgi:hypothetical protein
MSLCRLAFTSVLWSLTRLSYSSRSTANPGDGDPTGRTRCAAYIHGPLKRLFIERRGEETLCRSGGAHARGRTATPQDVENGRRAMKRVTIERVGFVAALLAACGGSTGESEGFEVADEISSLDSAALERGPDGEQADEERTEATSADIDKQAAGEGQDEEVDSSPGFDDFAALDTDGPREFITASYADCPPGNICFFTGRGGSGSMCRWTEHDTDWNSGGTVCSWARTNNVCSVSNRTIWRMEYFKGAQYQDRVGSTLSGVSGDLACSYKLASHRKQF